MTCMECSEVHDLDTNAAKNILAAGHCRIAAVIPPFPPKRQSFRTKGGEDIDVRLDAYFDANTHSAA